MQSVGIIGLGAFGELTETLLKRLAPQVKVRVHSSRYAPDGERFFSLEETCQANALILAVPIRAFGETLDRVLPHLGKDTVLVDVATVKSHTAKLLREKAGSRPYIATHPMFGPESYKKQGSLVEGFRIVITEHTIPGERYEKLVDILSSAGFRVIELGSEEHDRLLAESLFVTHFLAQTLTRASIGRTPIDTLSFGYLMDAVESVRNDTELFRDVFRFNPYCADIIAKLADAAQGVKEELDGRG